MKKSYLNYKAQIGDQLAGLNLLIDHQLNDHQLNIISNRSIFYQLNLKLNFESLNKIILMDPFYSSEIHWDNIWLYLIYILYFAKLINQ